MSYKSRQAFINENAAAFIPGVNKWTGAEVQNQFANAADSTMWIDRKLSTPNVTGSFNYDCAVSSLQEVTLTGNVTALTISNAVQGMYYTLIKKGAFTLQLPTGNFSANGNTTNTTTTVITFMYDGSNYYFNFSTYLVI